MPTALITGCTGQDGSYLAEFLLAKNYVVHGIIRRSSSFNTSRIDHIFDRLHLHHGDVTDASRVASLIHQIKPDEVYNLAAQSHVGDSFEEPVYTTEVAAIGLANILEACRGTETRIYQASTSEMFGNEPAPQNESTPFSPRSPYGCAKVYAHNLARVYREAYGMFVACGIMFNHESPRRGETFVTRKISRAVAAIKAGKQDRLILGNLKARRDWGYAGDYVRAMWLMLQKPDPQDFVIATGVSHTVGEFVEEAFGYAGIDWRKHVKCDARYIRPAEVDDLRGDASRARVVLGWEPRVEFRDLVRMMVDSDMEETCNATKLKCACRMTSNCGSGSMPSVTTSTSIN
ncbi:MAG TPA: GDP-mannose 4,6-dehydratase [Phycisphaerae bacterium]|nr:GDP-mannose 4,6-dehydratase [Phycisphaerae bacterium]